MPPEGLGGAGRPGDARELRHELVPAPLADPRAEDFLCSVPGGKGTLEPGPAGARQRDQPLAAVFARPPPDPSLLLERSQSPGERRAVENENLAEAALGELAGQKEDLEERELRDVQAGAADLLVVDLTHSPGGPAQVRARAGQDARTVGSLTDKPSPDRGFHASTLTSR
jgi:hypothetical protein